MVTFILNWLAQPETDGPRFLICCSENDFFKKIYNAIREVNQICNSIFNGMNDIFSNSLPQRLRAHLPSIWNFTAMKKGKLPISFWRTALERNCMVNGLNMKDTMKTSLKSLATKQIATLKKSGNGLRR